MVHKKHLLLISLAFLLCACGGGGGGGGPDTTPDAFSFPSISDVSPRVILTSAPVTVTGINAPASITVDRGWYSIDGGPYIHDPGVISNGQTLRLRLRSSSSGLSPETMTVNIGGVQGRFTITTQASLQVDTVPEPFDFPDITNATPGSTISFNFQITGINNFTVVRITGEGSLVSNLPSNPQIPETGRQTHVSLNDSNIIEIRVQAPSTYASVKNIIITIGGVIDSFTVSTAMTDVTPDPFSFTAQSDAGLGEQVESNSALIGGISGATQISISRGEFSIDGGPFSNATRPILDGQTVVVRQFASLLYATTTHAELTVGSVTGTFSVTTLDNPNPEAPEARIIFPPPNSLADSGTITVTGTASDPDSVASVLVNGVTATTADGFATWRATIPLVPGENEIAVSTEDSDFNVNPVAAKISINNRSTTEFQPKRIVVSNAHNSAYVENFITEVVKADRDNDSVNVEPTVTEIVKVDLTTGARKVLASLHNGNIGEGPQYFEELGGLDVDETNNRLVALEGETVFSIDLTTGERVLLSNNNTGSGLRSTTLTAGLVVDPLGAFAYILDPGRGAGALMKFNLVNGNRTVVSGDTSGQMFDAVTGFQTSVSGPPAGVGPDFQNPRHLAIDFANNRAFVVNAMPGVDEIFEVSLTTGDRSLLSGSTAGNGPELENIRDMVLDGNRLLAMEAESGTIIAIDLGSGDRSVILNESGNFMALDSGNSRLLIPAPGSLNAVDIDSGVKTLLSKEGWNAGFGEPMLSPYHIELDKSRKRILYTSGANEKIFELDLVTGERSLFSSDEKGSGPNFQSAFGFVYAESLNTILVLDKNLRALFSINAATGERKLLSTDVDTRYIRCMAFDPGNNRIIMTSEQDYGLQFYILSYDAITGEGSALYRFERDPDAYNACIGMAINQSGDLLAMVMPSPEFYDAVATIGLNTGVFSWLSNSLGWGTGPFIDEPLAVAFNSDDSVWVTDAKKDALFAVSIPNGSRQLIASPSVGSGAPLKHAEEVEFDDVNNLLYVGDVDMMAIFAVEPVSGDRVIIAK